jgi:glyoxylase-like metal-dependent hydrolase (beta-lactamase superfamily II)
MKLQLFNIVNFRVDGGAMFGVVPKILWSRVYRSDDNNLIVLALRSLIAETDERIILTDNGWGDKQDRKFFRHVSIHGGEGLIDGLKNRGYEPEDITDVVLTHLHADHCGGGVKLNKARSGFELTFPNAIYHVSRTQWEWAARSNVREEDSFLGENILPLLQSGHLNLVDEEGELFKNFAIRFCYGHTPGLMIPVINYKNRTFVFAGDLIPTAAHIPLIWNTSYDVDPLKSIHEKEDLLKESLNGNYILLLQHDENTECCTLERSDKGIRVRDKFKFSDLE